MEKRRKMITKCVFCVTKLIVRQVFKHIWVQKY